MPFDGELGALQRRITQLAGGPAPRSLAQFLRYLLSTPDPDDGLPAFLPYHDHEGNEVWAERVALSSTQWKRVRAYALWRVRAELDPLDI
jgi:hypothetical protein